MQLSYFWPPARGLAATILDVCPLAGRPNVLLIVVKNALGLANDSTTVRVSGNATETWAIGARRRKLLQPYNRTDRNTSIRSWPLADLRSRWICRHPLSVDVVYVTGKATSASVWPDMWCLASGDRPPTWPHCLTPTYFPKFSVSFAGGLTNFYV